MTSKPDSENRKAHIRKVTEALVEAGKNARTVAALTNTDLIYVKEGKLVRERPLASDIPYLRALE